MATALCKADFNRPQFLKTGDFPVFFLVQESKQQWVFEKQYHILYGELEFADRQKSNRE
jgi:hypothetical protein